MSPVFLALRRTSPPGFWRGLFAAITRWRLVSQFPHAGMVLDGVLMHSTLSDGVHTEPFLESAGWQLYPLTVDPAALLQRFGSVEGWPYDVTSLLAFGPPIKVRDSSRLYCFELVYFLITGSMPADRVTAEDLLVLAMDMNNRSAAQ